MEKLFVKNEFLNQVNNYNTKGATIFQNFEVPLSRLGRFDGTSSTFRHNADPNHQIDAVMDLLSFFHTSTNVTATFKLKLKFLTNLVMQLQ